MQNSSICSFTNSDSWVVLSPIELGIKQKIEAIGTPLKDWDIQINYGIKTGFNDAFIIDGKKRAELIAADPKSAEIIRPILRGRDIKRFSYDFADLHIIATFPAKHYDIDDYPAIKTHLLSYGIERLEQTGKEYIVNGEPITARKKTNNQWFETQDSISYWDDFNKQKIVWLTISNKAKFAIDNSCSVCLNSAFYMTGDFLHTILSHLNSKLIEWYFDGICVSTGDGTNKWEKFVVEKIPIPCCETIKDAKYKKIIQELTNCPSSTPEYLDILGELNRLICLNYGLDEEEIRVIEEN